jgi:hypothetical protein
MQGCHDGKHRDRNQSAGEGNTGVHGALLFRRIGMSTDLPLGRNEGWV